MPRGAEACEANEVRFSRCHFKKSRIAHCKETRGCALSLASSCTGLHLGAALPRVKSPSRWGCVSPGGCWQFPGLLPPSSLTLVDRWKPGDHLARLTGWGREGGNSGPLGRTLEPRDPLRRMSGAGSGLEATKSGCGWKRSASPARCPVGGHRAP